MVHVQQDVAAGQVVHGDELHGQGIVGQVVYVRQDKGLEIKLHARGPGKMSAGANGNIGDANIEEQAVAQVVHGPQDEEGKLDVQMLVLEFMAAREVMLGDKKQDAV